MDSTTRGIQIKFLGDFFAQLHVAAFQILVQGFADVVEQRSLFW